MKLSILGFGCGAVGGLMVRGSPADQERAIGRALDSGVNYFDTAVLYGNGESEKNLGRCLNKLKPRDAVVGTKVRLPPDTRACMFWLRNRQPQYWSGRATAPEADTVDLLALLDAAGERARLVRSDDRS